MRRACGGGDSSAPRPASGHTRSHVSSSHWRFRARHAFASVGAPSNSRCDARKSRCDARLGAPDGAHQGPVYHSATVGLIAGSRGASEVRKIDHLHMQSPFVPPAPWLCWATEEVEPGRSECRLCDRTVHARAGDCIRGKALARCWHRRAAPTSAFRSSAQAPSGRLLLRNAIVARPASPLAAALVRAIGGRAALIAAVVAIDALARFAVPEFSPPGHYRRSRPVAYYASTWVGKGSTAWVRSRPNYGSYLLVRCCALHRHPRLGYAAAEPDYVPAGVPEPDDAHLPA